MSFEDLKQENAALKAQLRNLEERLVEHDRLSVEQTARLEKAVADAQEKAQVLHATLNSIVDGVVVWNMAGEPTHVNRAVMDIIGTMQPERRIEDLSAMYGIFRADGVTPFPVEEMPITRALHGEHVEGVESLVRNARRPDGVWMVATATPIRTEDGTMLGAVQVLRDITEHKRREQREREHHQAIEQEREDLLERLQLAVSELSTPVLEVWEDVLVLPVIGVVDSQRSAEMMDRLLEAVEQKQCRHVIIDITGVDVIDTATAQQFVKLVTAVEYLGARCVLTGTRSAVAQTLVSLGVDLSPLTMLRTLKHGLRECMRRMDAESARFHGRSVIEAARERAAHSSGGEP